MNNEPLASHKPDHDCHFFNEFNDLAPIFNNLYPQNSKYSSLFSLPARSYEGGRRTWTCASHVKAGTIGVFKIQKNRPMTEQIQSNALSQFINILFDFGLSQGMPKIAHILIDAAMLTARNHHLQVDDYQRTTARNGYADGFKPKAFHSSMGRLDLNIPQVRDCQEPFYPSLFERGSRVDQALKTTIAEMYLQGISTRKVTKVKKKPANRQPPHPCAMPFVIRKRHLLYLYK